MLVGLGVWWYKSFWSVISHQFLGWAWVSSARIVLHSASCDRPLDHVSACCTPFVLPCESVYEAEASYWCNWSFQKSQRWEEISTCQAGFLCDFLRSGYIQACNGRFWSFSWQGWKPTFILIPTALNSMVSRLLNRVFHTSEPCKQRTFSHTNRFVTTTKLKWVLLHCFSDWMSLAIPGTQNVHIDAQICRLVNEMTCFICHFMEFYVFFPLII